MKETFFQQENLKHRHGSHVLNPSPWPIFMSLGLFQLAAWFGSLMHDFIPSISYFNMLVKFYLFHLIYYFKPFENNEQDRTLIIYENIKLIYLVLILSICAFSFWIRDVVREGTFTDHHTRLVKKSLRLGMLLFIISEMFFFLGFFWAYFHAALAPTIALGSVWPPTGIPVISAYEIPLANTIILLSSGACITAGHYQHLRDKREYRAMWLFFTIILALIFTRLQIFEYFNAAFNLSDGVYGSCFYLQLGFMVFMLLLEPFLF